MIVDDLHERVGHARVVDVVSAIAAATAIETPAIIDLTDSEHFPMRPTPRFDV